MRMLPTSLHVRYNDNGAGIVLVLILASQPSCLQPSFERIKNE
jgi:hypothetical protein